MVFSDGRHVLAVRQHARNLTLRVLRIALGVKAVFLHSGVKGRAGQAEQLGRPGLIALGPLEGFGQQQPFDLFQKPLAGTDSSVRTEPALNDIEQPLIIEIRGLRRPAPAVEFPGQDAGPSPGWGALWCGSSPVGCSAEAPEHCPARSGFAAAPRHLQRAEVCPR